MSWSIIQSSEVLAQFTPAEQAVLNNMQAINLTATTAVDGILAGAVATARGCIAAGGNPLDLAGTIPDQIRQDVISIARWRWLTSFPQLKALQTKDRAEAAKDGQARLDNIAAGKIKVETAANGGDASTIPTQSPAFGCGARQRRDRREQELNG
jgi:hypothetical protein